MHLPFFSKREAKIKPVVLVVLDGFGVAPPSQGNAITKADTPNYDRLIRQYPHGELIASGESVGLPANEVGNTEVGHLTLGAGRVILQDLKKISVSIEKGRFFDNKAFLAASAHVKKNNSKFHIMGLASSGSVHSSMEHLYATLQFCKKEEIKDVYLHLFTDGRDAPPKEGAQIIQKVEDHLETIKIGQIASISGRYYAMDRDMRWDRTKRAYDAIVLGRGKRAASAVEAVKSAYKEGKTDEFVEPAVVVDNDGPIATVDDKDAAVFFNFRIDRPKQLTMAFVLPDFEDLKSFDLGYDPETRREQGEVEVGNTFEREKVPKDLCFVTMTEYEENLPVSAVAFGPEIVETPLPEILSEAGLFQIHMAESEKERFVKYYLNGLREEPFEGEEDVIVPSPKVATYDKKPDMSLPKLFAEFKKALKKDKYHFFIMNIANPDMVAHSGSLEATIEAIGHVDKYLGGVVDLVLGVDGTVIITADHGNAEELLTFPTATYFITTSKGSVNTDHSNNPVPLIIANNAYEGSSVVLRKGGLSDVAPTILHIMGIEKPQKMTGVSLLKERNKKDRVV